MTAPVFLPCAAGVEALLAVEVGTLLGGVPVRSVRGGVAFDAEPAQVMAVNLHSRLAQRVLVDVADGPYTHELDIYALARTVDWARWITPSHTLRVDVTAQRSPLRSLQFAALRVKDAVCDQLREQTGERPNVDTRQPDLPLVLHLGPERATLYVDTSGEPLFKRGWRFDKGDAPLKETLAAAMLAAAGWDGSVAAGALHDPCCGSGTIAIEAAQIACGIAPGLQRRYAFERQLPFTDDVTRAQWEQLQNDARARIHPSAVPIYASDVAFRMIDFARRNAERAGVADAIQFNGGDALERPAPVLPAGMRGSIVLNPPYGERIAVLGKAGRDAPGRMSRATGSASGPVGAAADDNRGLPDDFFGRLATHWKRSYTGGDSAWTAWVLSPDMKLPTAMRLKESLRIPLWNGPIECRLFRFDLVAGGMRRGPAAGA